MIWLSILVYSFSFILLSIIRLSEFRVFLSDLKIAPSPLLFNLRVRCREEKRSFDNSRRCPQRGGVRRVVRYKMATRPSPGNIDPRRRGFAELEKEKITLFDARGRSKSSSMYTGRSQMARIVKGASRGRGKILVRRKRIEVEGVSGSRQLFRQGRVVLLIRRGENDFSERGRKREKIWWKTRSREILWSLTEVSVESGLSGDEN